MVPQATCPPARQCWLRAWERAKAEKLIPFRNQDGTWTVKTYTVSVVGAGWSDLSCTCAGKRHVACKHRAVVAKALAIGVRPVRGSEKGKEVATPAASLATAMTFTPAAIRAETTRQRAAAQARYDVTVAAARAHTVAQRAAGIDPLLECFA